MKKVFYVVLLLVELLLGLYLLNAARAFFGALPCVIVLVVWAVLLVCHLLKWKKNTDEAAVPKMKKRLALIMLIPIAAAVGILIWFFIRMLQLV